MPRREGTGSTVTTAREPGTGDGGHKAARTALLLPALSSISAAAEMAPLAARLEPWLHCTAVDWPGFGDRPREELYDGWAHPTPMVYAAIAEDVYALLVAQGVVAGR